MGVMLKHPLLGDVEGIQHQSEDVTQYLGVQYANLAHRFAAPVVKTDYEGMIDATSFGPSVVTAPIGCDIEFGLIQKALDKPSVPPVSDLHGLNVNISVPATTPGQAQGKLPVLVFIHGGGFLFGGNWAPHYDLARIVAFSASVGRPIIGVSLNYRLGVPGFLDSRELREAGIPQNRGILDQKAAFRWIQNNIAGFGGDSRQITAIGQSAGGSSVMHLLNSEVDGFDLFHRAICLSGNIMAAAVFPEAVAQHAYSQVLQCLDIDPNLSSESQVAALTAVAAGDLLTKIPPSVPLGPVVKEDHLPSFGSIKAQSPRYGVPLMIGSTDFDGAIFEVLGIFAGRDEGTLAEDFGVAVQRFVPQSQHSKVSQLLKLYGIESVPAARAQESRSGILQFGTDLKYFASSRAYATSWPSESWLYYFNEQNPWDGPHKGRSAHCLDIAYLFLNYKDVMSEAQLGVATNFARAVIGFIHGEQPYPEHRSSRQMKVYGPPLGGDDKGSCVDLGEAGPSAAIRKLWDEIGLDVLAKAWDAYLTKQ